MSLQNTFILDVDFKKSNFINEPVVTQNDDVTFILNVFDDGMEYDFTTVSTSTLVSVRPDRQSVMTLGTKTGNNQINFALGSTELSKVGKINAVIQLYGVDGRVSTLPFTYQVLKDPATDYVPSTNEKTLIELVLGQGPAILTAAEEATQEALEAAEIARNAEGPMGPQGPKGDRGATGVQGPKGDTGATGATGPQGQQGPKGDKGPKGDNFTVDASGLLSNRSTYDGQPIGFSYLATDTASLYIRQGSGWSAPIPFGQGEQGETGPIGPQGLPGPKGAPGIQGPKGDTGEKGDKGEPGTTVWNGISDKPEAFPPEEHNHSLDQVEGLQTALEEKAPLTHVDELLSENEVHGMRVNIGGKFEFFNGNEWVEVSSSGGAGGENWETISDLNLSDQPSLVDFGRLTEFNKLRLELKTITLTASSVMNIQVNYNTTEYTGTRASGTSNTNYTTGLATTASISSNVYFNAVFDIEHVAGANGQIYLEGRLGQGTTSDTSNVTSQFFRGMFRWQDLPNLQIQLASSSAKFKSGFVVLRGVRK